ncbi:MAG TPA: ATP-binding cassette domain-containing protein [Solirubrobacteraceae bacterium]|nr:ATP-binding cassette domain-containing protein [Solirubrobacteraceae bacterium]
MDASVRSDPPAADVPGRGTREPGPTQSSHTAAIELRGARASIGGHEVWSGVELVVRPGEFVAVLGSNGSGKSTLLKAILGLVETAPGAVSVLGGPAGSANREIGYLPQRHGFGSGLPLRGVDLVRLGLDGASWGLPTPLGRRASRRRARERVREVIELVGASAYAERTLGELSGGEQQRILIAQALVRRPRILMLDEPLDSLDLPNQAAVTALVQHICRAESVAVLLVAHDVNPLLPYLDQVIYLAGGRALQGPVEQVITGPTLSALYGVPIEVLRTGDGRLVVVGQPEAPHVHGPRHG